MRALFLATILLLGSTPAFAADLIEGDWLTDENVTLRAVACDDEYCIKVIDGPDAGKDIGRVAGADGYYEGKIFNPQNGDAYDGTVQKVGETLEFRGCVLFILCETKVLTRK